jgi:hypothetical protein
VRRALLSALFLAVVFLGMAEPTPALAHEPTFTASSGGAGKRVKEAQSEAGQLTDELRHTAIRSTKLPAIQAAVAK